MRLFLIQVHVFGPAGIVDENCQQDDGSMEEEAQCRMEVKQEQGKGWNQDGGDLACQHVEHVVSEFQDEGHRQTQSRWGEGTIQSLSILYIMGL